MAPSKQTAFHLFNSLKSDQLSRLFSLCGIGGASAATKATKSRILTRALPSSQYLPVSQRQPGNNANSQATQRARLLSIDMGLKNLAYCVLDVDLSSSNSSLIKGSESINPEGAISSIANGESILPNALAHVTLVGWKRVDVLAEAAKLNPQNTSLTSDAKVVSEPVENDGHLETNNKDTEKKVPSDTFEPLKLSRIAYNLIQREFLQYNPTHIVIERQRHRTGGHSSIQEWTVRVNTFEACLWAVLTTLQQQQQSQHGLNDGSGDGSVDAGYMHLASVLPNQVAKFWLDDKPSTPTPSSSSLSSSPESTKTLSPKRSRHEKSDKINLAYTWLNNTSNTNNNSNNQQTSLKISKEAKDQVTNLVDSFIYTASRTNTNKHRTTSSGISTDTKLPKDDISKDNGKDDDKKNKKKLAKLDDLADCLLQALATVQWDLNRRAIFEGLVPGIDFDLRTSPPQDLPDIQEIQDSYTSKNLQDGENGEDLIEGDGEDGEATKVTSRNKVKTIRRPNTTSKSRFKSSKLKSKVKNQK